MNPVVREAINNLRTSLGEEEAIRAEAFYKAGLVDGLALKERAEILRENEMTQTPQQNEN
jgi:hypothetical protein